MDYLSPTGIYEEKDDGHYQHDLYVPQEYSELSDQKLNILKLLKYQFTTEYTLKFAVTEH